MIRKSAPKKSPKRNKGGWKSRQSEGKMSKQVRLGVTVLVFLVTLIFVGKTIDFLGSLNRPYAPDGAGSQRQGSWDNREVLNLVIKSNDVHLLSLDPRENSLSLFRIPPDAYINVPFGFGSWRMGSIYGLGQGETPPIGANLLTAGVSSSLGVPIDGYLVFPEGSEEKMENLIAGIKQNPLTLLSVLREGRTDLSLKEYWDFWWALKRIRSDKIETLDLGKTGIVVDKTLADGSRVYTLDQYKLDVLIQKQLEDLNLREEGLSVGIFNATGHPGLAEKASRVIANMGGRVIFTTNLDTKLDNSFVVEQHQEKGKSSYTNLRLAKVFSSALCTKKTGGSIFDVLKAKDDALKCSAENLNLSPNTADVNILLGEDYFLRYNRR